MSGRIYIAYYTVWFGWNASLQSHFIYMIVLIMPISLTLRVTAFFYFFASFSAPNSTNLVWIGFFKCIITCCLWRPFPLPIIVQHHLCASAYDNASIICSVCTSPITYSVCSPLSYRALFHMLYVKFIVWCRMWGKLCRHTHPASNAMWRAGGGRWCDRVTLHERESETHRLSHAGSYWGKCSEWPVIML